MGIKRAVRFSRTFWTHFAENEGTVILALNKLNMVSPPIRFAEKRLVSVAPSDD